jgi:hypothetical protein
MPIALASSALVGWRPSSSQLAAALAQLVEDVRLVHRQAHDVALLDDRLHDGLTDPPDRVGDELEALLLVEAVGGLDQTEVALVDEVEETEALADVLLGDRHDELQVRGDQFFESGLVPFADLYGDFRLALARQALIVTDRLKIRVERLALRLIVQRS